MVQNLKKLEIFFEPGDIGVFKDIKSWTEELRLLTERSELWLPEFFGSGNNREETDRITTLLERFADCLGKNNLLHCQIMMRHLLAYVPITNFVKSCIFQYRLMKDLSKEKQ